MRSQDMRYGALPDAFDSLFTVVVPASLRHGGFVGVEIWTVRQDASFHDDDRHMNPCRWKSLSYSQPAFDENDSAPIFFQADVTICP